MIKLIGEDESIYKISTCRNCAAKLQYTQSEVKEYHRKDYSGGSDGKEWINCPRCGHEVVLRAW